MLLLLTAQPSQTKRAEKMGERREREREREER